MGYYQSKRYEPPDDVVLKDLKRFDPRQMEISQIFYLDNLKLWRVSTLMYQLIIPVSLEVLIPPERLNGYTNIQRYYDKDNRLVKYGVKVYLKELEAILNRYQHEVVAS